MHLPEMTLFVIFDIGMTPFCENIDISWTLVQNQGYVTWWLITNLLFFFISSMGGDSRVVVSTAAFHARVWGSFLGLGNLKETKNVSSPSTVKISIVGSLGEQEVA